MGSMSKNTDFKGLILRFLLSIDLTNTGIPFFDFRR